MEEAPLAAAVRGILLAVAAALAAATLLFHGASLAGVPFGVQAPLAALLAAAAAGAVLFRGLRGLGPGIRGERRDALVLAALCGGIGLLLLVVQHATSDDSSYLPPVVRCLQHPDLVPGYYDFLWVGDPAPASPRWALPVPFDFLEGAFTWLTGVPLLWTRYVVAPALLGALLPATWFLLLSRIGFATRVAVAGTLAGGALLLLLRDTHGAPGCAFVLRVYQAKFFGAAVLLPLFAAEALAFARAPSRRAWLPLATVATAAAGCSLSTLMLVGLLAPAVALGVAVASPGGRRAAPGILAAVLYPALLGLWIHGDASEGLSPSSAANFLHDRTFEEQARHVFGGWLTPLAALGATAACAWSLRGSPRRFVLGWTGAVVVLYLNPWTAPFVIEHLASNIYWRVPYLLPWALLLGAPAAAWIDRDPGRPTLAVTAVAAILLLLQVPLQAAGTYRSLQYARPLPDPDRCLNREVAADARWIAAHAPAGPILAPQYVSTILVMVDADHPPLVHWPEPVRFWMERAGRGEEAEIRLRAGRDLNHGGRNAESIRALLRLHPGVASVLVSAAALPAVAPVLAEAGFTEMGTSPSGSRLFRRLS